MGLSRKTTSSGGSELSARLTEARRSEAWEEYTQTVTTAKGTELPVKWIAESDLDGSLRFEVFFDDLTKLFFLFNDPEETLFLTHRYDEKEIVFRGFTRFKGIERMPTGTTVVRLLPGSEIFEEDLEEVYEDK